MDNNFDQRKLRVFYSLVIGLVAIAAITFLWSQSSVGRTSALLKHELESASRDGMAISGADFQRRYSVPESSNARKLIQQAFAEMKRWQKTPAGRAYAKLERALSSKAGLRPEDVSLLKPTLTSAQSVISILKSASEKPKLDFERDWSKGPELQFPEYSDARPSITLLIADSEVKAHDGDYTGAIEDLDAGAKLSRLIGTDPSLIAKLIGCTMRSQISTRLEGIIRSVASNSGLLTKCKKVVTDFGSDVSLQEPIESEMLFGRSAVQLIAKSNNSAMFGASNQSVLSMSRFGPARAAYELKYVQTMHELYRELGEQKGSIPGMTAVVKKIEAKVRQSSDWTYGLTKLLTPSFVGSVSAIGDFQARQHVLLCAIDLLIKRNQTGSFPKLMLGTTGQWGDPFTEKPLIYKLTSKGFLIYSCGADGEDDGGEPMGNTRFSHFDIPFKFP